MGVLDQILMALIEVLTFGMGQLQPEVRWLMRVFIGIELVTAAAFWFFAQEQVLALLSFKVVRIGLFAMFVVQWPLLTGLFLDTMFWVGAQFSGGAMTPAQLSQPSVVLSTAFRATEPIFAWMNNIAAAGWRAVLTNLGNILMMAFAALGIWAAFLLTALHVMIALVMFHKHAAFLLIFIPFGVWTGTSFLAERSIGAIIAGAVRLGMMAMVLGITFPLLAGWRLPMPVIGLDPNPRQAFTLLAAAVGVFLLSWIVPASGASIFEGGPVLTGQGLLTGIGGGISRGVAAASGVGGVVTGAADMVKGSSTLVNSTKGAS
jgi:type IV secretion system protein TrbL